MAEKGVDIHLGLRAEKFRKALAKSAKDWDKLTNKIKKSGKGAGKGVEDLGKKAKVASNSFADLAKKAGAAAIAFISIRQLARGLGETINVAAEFGKRMSAVGAIMQATATEMKALEAVASKMGETTQFTALQAAEALQFLGMAGLTAAQSVEALPDVLNLAAAGGLDLATAADLATNVLAGLGKEVKDLGRVNDVLAFTASNANTSVEELGRAFRIAAPIAKSLNISMEDTAAILAQFANRGIKAENAGEKFKQLISRLVKPTGQAAAALKELGVNTRGADGELRNINDIMTDLKLAGLDAAQASDIFGKRAFAAALLAKDASGDVKLFGDRMKGAGDETEGFAEKVAKQRLDNFAGDITILKSALEGAMKALGGVVTESGEMRDVVKSITAAINDLTTLIKDNEDVIEAFIVEPLFAMKNSIKFISKLGVEIKKTEDGMIAASKGSGAMGQGFIDVISVITDLTPTLDNLYQKIVFFSGGTITNWKKVFKETEKMKEGFLTLNEGMITLKDTQKALLKEGLNESALVPVIQRLREMARAYADAGGDPDRFAKLALEMKKRADEEIKEVRKVAEERQALEVQTLNQKRAITDLEIKLEDAKAVQKLSVAKLTNEQIKRLDGEALASKIKAGNSEITALKQRLSVSENAYKQYIDKIKQLEDEKENKARSIEDKIREIGQKGLTEKQRQADILRQINEKIAAASSARLRGETEVSKKLLEEAESLTGRIENGKKQISILERLKGEFDRVADAEISSAKDAKAAEEEKIEIIKEQINKINEQLNLLKKEQVVEVEADITKAQSELQVLEDKLKELVKPKTIKINIERSGDLDSPKFKTGGHISGYGGGDKIHALVEKGEYVVRKEAVRKYGSGLFHALNNMRANLGNRVSSSIPKFAQGGMVGAPDVTPTEVVRLEIGSKHIDVASSKSNIMDFLEALQGSKTMRQG